MILKERIESLKNDELIFSEKVITKKSDAIKSVKEGEETYIHECFHDEANPKPCRLIKVK